jgi:hypothetical protein
VEKRRHPRQQHAIRCWIGDGSHTLYVRLHDISLSGLSVRAPVPFQPSGEVELSIELPDHNRVRARAEIVWTRNGPGSGPRMGARFIEILEGEEDLKALLDQNLKVTPIRP